MDLVHPDVDSYLADLAAPQDLVLLEMERLGAERGFPIVGPQVGRLLEVLTVASGARRVLELGSGFGYSAYWFARAVGPEGLVVLTDHSEAQADEARGFLGRGGLLDRVKIEVGPALEVAGGVEGSFDIVFCDIDKEDYPAALDVARARLRLGGMLVCDNMLWYGRVLAQEPDSDDTRGVVELTRRLREAEDFRTTLVPIRDGVTLSVRL